MAKQSHNAAAKVAALIQLGVVLCAYNVLDHEDTTVGPYTEALDRGNRFAVVSWGRGNTTFFGGDRLFRTADEAAACFVGRVGSTRAREAAEKKAAKRRREGLSS